MPRPRRSARLPLAPVRAAGVVAALVLLALPGRAAAHTDLDYTVPADGEQAAAPVADITVAFEDTVALVENGFEVLAPDGTILQPEVFTEDNATYFLQLAQPLTGGEAAVRYEVAAADGHVLEGGFSFTVPEAVPGSATSAPAAPATSGAPPDASLVVVTPASGDPDGGGSGTGIAVGIVAAVALGAAAFLVLRSRLSKPT